MAAQGEDDVVMLALKTLLPGTFWPGLFLLGWLVSAVILLDVLRSDPAMADLLGAL